MTHVLRANPCMEHPHHEVFSHNPYSLISWHYHPPARFTAVGAPLRVHNLPLAFTEFPTGPYPAQRGPVATTGTGMCAKRTFYICHFPNERSTPDLAAHTLQFIIDASFAPSCDTQHQSHRRVVVDPTSIQCRPRKDRRVADFMQFWVTVHGVSDDALDAAEAALNRGILFEHDGYYAASNLDAKKMLETFADWKMEGSYGHAPWDNYGKQRARHAASHGLPLHLLLCEVKRR